LRSGLHSFNLWLFSDTTIDDNTADICMLGHLTDVDMDLFSQFSGNPTRDEAKGLYIRIDIEG
jgi:hypothetical protein